MNDCSCNRIEESIFQYLEHDYHHSPVVGEMRGEKRLQSDRIGFVLEAKSCLTYGVITTYGILRQ